MSSYFHHVIQYFLQNSNNRFYNFNLFTFRKNNSLKMIKIIQSVFSQENIKNSSAKLFQNKMIIQKKFSNFIDSQKKIFIYFKNSINRIYISLLCFRSAKIKMKSDSKSNV